jgi:hypothetical protein
VFSKLESKGDVVLDLEKEKEEEVRDRMLTAR